MDRIGWCGDQKIADPRGRGDGRTDANPRVPSVYSITALPRFLWAARPGWSDWNPHRLILSLIRRLSVIRQLEVEEDVVGAVVDVHLAHPGALHHRVEGMKFFEMNVIRSSGSYCAAG